jgi:geranylgeranyl diphosphate synthase type II
VATDADQLGKPVGQDALLGRPSAAADLGIEGAAEKLLNLVENAVASIPDCQKADELRMLVTLEAKRFLPTSLSRLVA